MEKTGTGDVSEDPAQVPRQTLGQLGPRLAVEGALRVEKVGAIEDTPHHVPLGQAEGMIPHRVEHAAVDLAFRLGAGGAGRTMPELLRSGRSGRPLSQLLRRRVPQGVVQPDGAQPAIPLRIRHAHLLRPVRREQRHALDVLHPTRCDDGPLG